MRAAIYCRLSEEDRNKARETDDSASIQNQKAMLLQYAAEQGWEIYSIYSDDDRTGADRDRPEFNRLLRDARQHRFDVVLCKTQSRFTRELELVEKYLHGLFPLWGIRFVSIVDNADTANKGNKKSRQINGLVNEWYLEDLSENIKSVLTSRRQNGFHIGSFAPYGYRKDPAVKGHLIIDEEAAPVVREIFALFAQGRGKTSIARTLNDRGVPNPTEYKRLQGLRYQQPKGKNSGLWRYSTISSILTNPVYRGDLIQGKTGSVSYKTKVCRPRPKSQWIRVENTHEPIIDRELWDRVQERIAERTRPLLTGEVGLFAGKARCAGCGYTMKSSKTRDGRRYLQCPSRAVSNNACEGAFLSVERLERMVLAELARLTEAYLDRDELERRIDPGSALVERREKLKRDMEACERKREEYTRGLRELYLDKAKGLLTERDCEETAKDLLAQRERLERAAAEGKNQLAGLEEQLAAGPDRRERIRSYTEPEHLDRETVETLIDYISVGKRIPGTRDVPIEIHWKF